MTVRAESVIGRGLDGASFSVHIWLHMGYDVSSLITIHGSGYLRSEWRFRISGDTDAVGFLFDLTTDKKHGSFLNTSEMV